MKMKKSTPQPIGDVLKDVVEKLSQPRQKDITKIASVWPAVMGKEFVGHARPASLRKGTLRIFVENSAWFYQANLQKERLLQTLKRKIGEKKVQDIQFRIGKI